MTRTERNHAASPGLANDVPRCAHCGAPLRVVPHNIEAEQALLGAVLVNNDVYDRVRGFLDPGHFYDPLHQRIYETAGAQIAKGQAASPITLKAFFENTAPVDAITTAPQYLGRLAATHAATLINARDYARTIHDLWTRRQLIVIGEDLVNVAFDAPVDFPPKEQIDEAETRLFALGWRGSHERDSRPLIEVVDSAIAQIDAAYKRGGGLAGLSTGITGVDRLWGGLRPGNFDVLAARPSMGKTALACNIGYNIAEAGTPVHVFSLEMTAEQLATRQLSRMTGIPVEDLDRGRVVEADFLRLNKARQQMDGWPMHIDASGGLTMPEIATKARRICRQKGTKAIIIDYVQLVNGSVYRGQNRTQEITEVTNGLKSLAKELNVPILALAQLSREVEKRDDKRPQLSDLRESGSLEQDADAVSFLYRHEYYLDRNKPDPDKNADEYAKWQADLARSHGKAELIVAKMRMGRTGTAHLSWVGETNVFSTPAEEMYP